MGNFVDRAGRRYGRLTVVNRAPNNGRSMRWNCRCDCGNEVTVHGTNLQSGATQACGQHHPRSWKLTAKDVREIRLAAQAGESLRCIADRFGITTSNVRHIVLRRSWRGVA